MNYDGSVLTSSQVGRLSKIPRMILHLKWRIVLSGERASRRTAVIFAHKSKGEAPMPREVKIEPEKRRKKQR